MSVATIREAQMMAIRKAGNAKAFACVARHRAIQIVFSKRYIERIH